MNGHQQLISIVKQQAEIFLLEEGDFYPFGTYLTHSGEIVPVSAFIEEEDDRPNSNKIISLLEKASDQKLISGECSAFAIATDVAINEGGVKYDAVQIRIKEQNNSKELFLKYQLNETSITFLNEF